MRVTASAREDVAWVGRCAHRWGPALGDWATLWVDFGRQIEASQAQYGRGRQTLVMFDRPNLYDFGQLWAESDRVKAMGDRANE